MTREQIHIGDMSHETTIGILKLMLEAMETYDGISPTPERVNAVKMAIKALEQETVSKESYDHEYFLRKEFEIKIAKLQCQLKEQEPKIGHWIDADSDNAICSCCNRLNHLYGTYCKHCGAKMIAPQESEEV